MLIQHQLADVNFWNFGPWLYCKVYNKKCILFLFSLLSVHLLWGCTTYIVLSVEWIFQTQCISSVRNRNEGWKLSSVRHPVFTSGALLVFAKLTNQWWKKYLDIFYFSKISNTIQKYSYIQKYYHHNKLKVQKLKVGYLLCKIANFRIIYITGL